MAKLISQKYKKGEYRDRTIQFPLIGIATFDSECKLEVPDHLVNDFIALTADSFNFYDEANPPIVDEEEELDNALIQQIEEASDDDLQVIAAEFVKRKELDLNQATFMTTEKLRITLIALTKAALAKVKAETPVKATKEKRSGGRPAGSKNKIKA